MVGVDLDPVLIEAARADEPGPVYLVGDLAALDLPGEASGPFDAILCAGNVLGFLHPATRRPALAALGRLLASDGRLIAGFGAGRGYGFEEFFADAEASGLRRDAAFSTWDRRGFTPASDFLVVILSRA